MAMTSTPTTTTSLLSTNIKAKRKRIGGTQSKYGCFTCRARRVKCDEQKPHCLQCTRTGRACDGYPSRVFIVHAPPAASPISETDATNSALSRTTSRSLSKSLSKSPSPCLVLQACTPQTPEQAQVLSAGLGLLLSDQGPIVSNKLLNHLLPQMSYSVPSLQACVAALGSAFLFESTNYTSFGEEQVISHYIKALRCVQMDVGDRPHGTFPLMLSCFLLAFVEALLKKLNNALVHLHGGHQLLAQQQLEPTGRHKEEEADLEDLFRAMDLHAAEYTKGYTPSFAPPERITIVTDLPSATREYYRLLHGARKWSSPRHRTRFRPWELPSAMIEQGRHISRLSSWLTDFDRVILSETPPGTAEHTRALCRKANCLAELIYNCCILSAPEATFDKHIAQFEELVQLVETVMRQYDQSYGNLDIPSQPCLPLSITGRFAYAVYFTATSCRHPQIRRRAIALLARCGREGPWLGIRDALKAARLVQHEEFWPNPPPPAPETIDAFLAAPVPTLAVDHDGNPNLLDLVPEIARIDAVGGDDSGFDLRSRQVLCRFIRCLDIHALMSCQECRNAPMAEVEANWFTTQQKCSGNHWEVWHEILTY